MSLSGKTLFVTGASRGIGLAIALRAARDGANVAIAAKTAEPHPKLPGTIYTAAEEIEAAGGKALPLIVDVRDEASVTAAVEQTVQHFGGLDICVNNASAISLSSEAPVDMMSGLPVAAMRLISGRSAISSEATLKAGAPRECSRSTAVASNGELNTVMPILRA